MRKHNSPIRGFTLLETLLAMIIMASAILLLANSWSASSMRIRKAQTSFEVGAMLERKMAEIDRDLKGKSFAEIPDEKEGDFGDDFPQYTWKMKSKKLEFPDFSSMLASKDNSGSGVDEMTQMMIKQIVDQMSKSIKEVTVTLILKQQNKNYEFNVTTYYVDYTKEPVIGVGGVN